MKQYLIMCLALMFITFGARATNSLTISSVSGRPGEEVTVAVDLTAEDAVAAVDIAIPVTDQTAYVAGSCELNEQRSAGHSVSAATTDGVLRILVYNFTLAPLNDGSSLLTFKLKLGKTPSCYALVPTVVLSDAQGASLSAESTAGEVTIVSPKLSVSPTSIDFGRSAIRGEYTRTLTLTNTGTELLTVSGFKTSAAELTVSPETLTVEAGSSRDVTVTYKPTVRATGITEKILVESDAINGTQTVAVSAIPYSVNELSVSSASGNSDSEVTISITMTNMEPIVSAQLSIKLPDALEYVAGSVEAGSRASEHTAYASVSDGVLNLFLINLENKPVSGNDGELMSFRLQLNSSTNYYLYLTPTNVVLSNASSENMVSGTHEGMVSIYAPTISTDDSLVMDDTSVTATAEKQLTISNYGPATLSISRVVFGDEGYSIKEELPIEVDRWDSTTITVCYASSTSGDYSTTMNIYSNDPDNRMKSVAVSGRLYEPNEVTFTAEPSSDYQECTLHASLTNYSEIAALQMDIHMPEGMTTSLDDLTLSDRVANHSVSLQEISSGVYRLVIFSLKNEVISDDSGLLFDIAFSGASCRNGSFTVDNILLSGANGEDYTSPDATIKMGDIVYITTGVETVPADEQSACRIYSLSGVLLKAGATKADCRELGPGCYIIVNGATAEKVVVK